MVLMYKIFNPSALKASIRSASSGRIINLTTPTLTNDSLTTNNKFNNTNFY